MRKFLTFIFLFLLLASSNASYALTETNSEFIGVKKIELIEKYITDHKAKIQIFGEKYQIQNNQKYSSYINDISDMIEILRRLKTSSLSEDEKSDIVLTVVRALKETNIKLRPILEENKVIYEKKIQQKSVAYSNLGKKISSQLNKLIGQIALLTKNKDISNTKKKEILGLLRELEQNSKLLNNFGKQDIDNIQSLKEEFLKILKNIKKEMASIKKILNG